MRKDNTIDYIEIPAVNLPATKSFFSTVFGWEFFDYGEEYSSFSKAGIQGGFFQSELSANTENGSVLVVLYSDDLEKTEEKVKKAGGIIARSVFQFPGGRRFHFIEPSGNEIAVWSDNETA